MVGGEVLKCRSSFQKKRRRRSKKLGWRESFSVSRSLCIHRLARTSFSKSRVVPTTRWRPHNRRIQSDFWGCFSDRWPVSPNFWLVIGRRSADGRLSCFGFDTSHLICSKNFIETRETTTTHHALIFSSSFLSQHSIIRS